MSKPVIPVLAIDKDQLTSPRDQVAYLLRHAFHNPGWTSSYIEYYLMSMQKMFAEFNYKVNDMVGMLRTKLQYSIDSMYPGEYKVNIGSYKINELTYGIQISITNNQDVAILSSDDIRIANNKIYLKGDNINE